MSKSLPKKTHLKALYDLLYPVPEDHTPPPTMGQHIALLATEAPPLKAPLVLPALYTFLSANSSLITLPIYYFWRKHDVVLLFLMSKEE